MEDLNPWVVDSVDAFLFWKCPECTFDTNIEDNFDSEETFVFSLKSQKAVVTDNFVIADCELPEKSSKSNKMPESLKQSNLIGSIKTAENPNLKTVCYLNIFD